MRWIFVVAMAGLISSSAPAGTIRFDAAPIGSQPGKYRVAANAFQITYTLEDFAFPANGELDIRFDPATYVKLWGGMTPADFDLVLLQPNNPPGTSGDFSVMALVDRPRFSGEFSVMVLMAGDNRPGEQDFVINQLDEHGVILSRISTGQTLESTVPEPATLPVVCAALLGGMLIAIRNRS